MAIPGLPVSAVAPFVERRLNRVTIPPCRACHFETPVVVLRTTVVLYARCPHCGDIQSVNKPHKE
jgi:hypothetical protein